MTFIAVDIGASFIKGCILDTRTLTMSDILKIPSPKELKNKIKTRKEFDPRQFEEIVRRIIKTLSEKTDIGGIIFSTQMHGMILVNGELKLLTDFISWQDERILEKRNKHETWMDLLERKLKHTDTADTGIKMKPGIMGTTLFWLSQNKYFKKKGSVKALFLGDYIAAKLSKGKHVAHPTNACGSGLFLTKKGIWSEKIIKVLGLDPEILPEIASTDYSVGSMQIRGKAIPVFVSYGDMQTAVLGSFTGLSGKREFCLNVGTGSQVSTVSNSYVLGGHDTRAYFDSKYLSCYTHIPAGRALNVLINFAEEMGKDIFDKKIDVWGKLINLRGKPEDTGGLEVNISFFKNNVAGRQSGYINSITETNFKFGNIFRGALINMVDNYAYFLNELNYKKKDSITVAGGLGRKAVQLNYLLRKKFGKQIKFSPNREETLSGLMILAVHLSGKFKNVKSASLFCRRKKMKIK